MIGFLTGLQGGLTKHPCFFCYWDSRVTVRHYEMKDWPSRTGFVTGKKNVKWQLLVEQEKILMPPLHQAGTHKAIYVGTRLWACCLHAFGSVISKVVGGQNKVRGIHWVTNLKTIAVPGVLRKVVAPEKHAWCSFVVVAQGFLGNNKEEKYRKLVDNLLKSYKEMGCRMSLKLHMIHSHLNLFKSNMADYSKEHGESFHQDVMEFEKCYQGQYKERMMGDYVWGLDRETQTLHQRRSRKSVCFQSTVLLNM